MSYRYIEHNLPSKCYRGWSIQNKELNFPNVEVTKYVIIDMIYKINPAVSSSIKQRKRNAIIISTLEALLHIPLCRH